MKTDFYLFIFNLSGKHEKPFETQRHFFFASFLLGFQLAFCLVLQKKTPQDYVGYGRKHLHFQKQSRQDIGILFCKLVELFGHIFSNMPGAQRSCKQCNSRSMLAESWGEFHLHLGLQIRESFELGAGLQTPDFYLSRGRSIHP